MGEEKKLSSKTLKRYLTVIISFLDALTMNVRCLPDMHGP